MAFEVEEVIQIIKLSEKVPNWVTESRKRHKTLRALIDGDDFKTELSKIEHIEKSEKKWKVRQKYSRSIKDLNQRLLRPIDNVYSATGGSKTYNLKGDNLKKLLDKLSNVRGNKSLEQWLQTNWMHVYHNDPDGVIFIEYTTKETEDCWPTYKEITRIRNYEKDGQSLKWILFEPKKVINPITKQPEEYIRFVDDVNDYTFRKDGSQYVLIEDLSFEHPFGRVPGLVNSDIEKLGVMNALTPIDAIVEPEQEYLRDQSIKTIHKFIRGLPIFWRYKMLCPTCHGTLKDGNGDCKSCDNTGFKLDSDISDEVVLPVPTSADDVKLAPDIAGWLTPPADILEEMNQELQVLEVGMYEAHWGSHKSRLDQNIDKTATEVWLDAQPVMNRLNKYGDVAEWVEHYMTELIANFIFTTKNKDENVSSIHYGRNYIIQPPEFLLQEYHKSKEAQDGVTILDRKLREYLTAKYKNDPQSLRIELLKAKLEPFVHYTIDMVRDTFGNEAAQKKMLFGDWWETLTFEAFETKTDQQLESEMKEFFEERLTEPQGSQNNNNE